MNAVDRRKNHPCNYWKIAFQIPEEGGLSVEFGRVDSDPRQSFRM